eukprot:c3962_g1_i1.p1 GENE.c3962_g1_i1~~c3962_g1_i1.p1  ORF type:complete len:855 (+),score=193.99 c3962_g1_i1:45-2567(+)
MSAYVFVLGVLLSFWGSTLVQAVDMSAPGPFQVGWQKLMMKPPSGLEFDSIVVYPSQEVGWQAAPDATNGPYPVLVFGHGYSTEPDSYMSTLQHLASWGYIVAAPEVPALHHLRYANEMSTCFTHLEKLNADPHSPFHGLIDHKHYGIFGHTAGAGAAIVAAAKDPRIRCLAALAPIDTMPSAILTIKKVHVPVNIIVAKDDWLASADKNAVPIYKNAHPPRQFHILSGGGNAYFYDGEGVHRQRQLRITRFFLTTWFNLYLRQDVHMWPYVWGENAWNDTVVFTVHDRGDPMELARRKTPTDSAIIELEEEAHMKNPLTFDPRNPRTFQNEFSKPGQHRVGNTNVTTTDKEGHMFSAVIYYPASSEGIGTPLDLDEAPYPVLVFAHGWFQVPESYATTLQHLASFGYVVLCSRASQELFVDQYALELKSIMDWIQLESGKNGSDWYQTVDPTRIGLLGHSIGGGVTILAAANDARVKALVLMAPSQTHHPSSYDYINQVHAPMCFLCADDEEDGDVRLHTMPLFAKASPPKLLHQFMNGSNTFFSDGMLLGSQHRKQLKASQDVTRSFFDLYLKGDYRKGFESAWRNVWGPEAVNMTKVTHTLVAGFVLGVTGNRTISIDRGQTCDFEITLNNTSPTSHVFDVFVDNNVWPVDAPARTGRVRPRQTASFHVLVRVPRNTHKATNHILISVRSDSDGFTRQAIEVECNVPVWKVKIEAKKLPAMTKDNKSDSKSATTTDSKTLSPVGDADADVDGKENGKDDKTVEQEVDVKDKNETNNDPADDKQGSNAEGGDKRDDQVVDKSENVGGIVSDSNDVEEGDQGGDESDRLTKDDDGVSKK